MSKISLIILFLLLFTENSYSQYDSTFGVKGEIEAKIEQLERPSLYCIKWRNKESEYWIPLMYHYLDGDTIKKEVFSYDKEEAELLVKYYKKDYKNLIEHYKMAHAWHQYRVEHIMHLKNIRNRYRDIKREM